MNLNDILYTFFLAQIFVLVKVKCCGKKTQEKHCFNNELEFEEWLKTPCYDNGHSYNLSQAITQMGIFKTKLDDRIECMGMKPDEDYGESCPNIRRLLKRLGQEQKISVFNNMLLKLSIFVQQIYLTIPDEETDRKQLYSEILCEMRIVACEFHRIQPQTRTKSVRDLRLYRDCTQPWQNCIGCHELFDKHLLQSFKKFIDECLKLFKNLHRWLD